MHQEIRLRGTVTRALNQAKVGSLSASLPENEWKMGQKVKHEKFGFGTVINVEGSDNNTRYKSLSKLKALSVDCSFGKIRKSAVESGGFYCNEYEY